MAPEKRLEKIDEQLGPEEFTKDMRVRRISREKVPENQRKNL
jgi:hypothetical protein